MVNEHSANDPQGSDLSSPSTHTDQPDTDQQHEADMSSEAVPSATDSQDPESLEPDASTPHEETDADEGTEDVSATNPAEVDHGFDEVFAGVVDTSGDESNADGTELDESTPDETVPDVSDSEDAAAPDAPPPEGSGEEAIADSRIEHEEEGAAEDNGDPADEDMDEALTGDSVKADADADAIDAEESATEEEAVTEETVATDEPKSEPETELAPDADLESTAPPLEPVTASGEATDINSADAASADIDAVDVEAVPDAEAEPETVTGEEPENVTDTNEADTSEAELNEATSSDADDTQEEEAASEPVDLSEPVDSEPVDSEPDDIAVSDSSDDGLEDEAPTHDGPEISESEAEPEAKAELDDDWDEEEEIKMTTDDVPSADAKQPALEETPSSTPANSQDADAPPAAARPSQSRSPKPNPSAQRSSSSWAKIQPILTATFGIILTTLIQWLTLGQEALTSAGDRSAEGSDQGASGNSIPASIWKVVQPLLAKVLAFSSQTLASGLGWILSKVDAEAYAAVKEGTAPTLPERIQALPFGDKIWDVLETIWKLWAGLLGFLRDRLFPESIRHWSNRAITATVAAIAAVILWISSALSPSPAQEIASPRVPGIDAAPKVERTVPVKKTNSAKDKTLAASIQERLVEEFTPRYSEDLIQDVSIDRGRDRLTVTIGQEWYDLNERQQQRLAKTILSDTDDTPFNHLTLVNLDGVRIARNPVVGSDMILYQTVPPVIEEPVIEEPVAEEPVAEEPVVEEPVAEDSITEEAGIEDAENLETTIMDESGVSEDVALPDGSPFSQDEIGDGSFAFE